MTTPGAFGGGTDLERFKAKLAGWRTSLVDLSGRNRLLNFRHTRSATLEISYPTAEELVEKIESGWDFAVLPDEEPEPADGEPGATGEDSPAKALPTARRGGIVTQKTTNPALLRALRTLRGKSTQLFNDYGLWTLNLGVGMVRWREDGAESTSDAPLVLLPVRIERTAAGRVRLRLNDDEDAKFNPALRVKLEQFHIDWSLVSDQDPLDVPGVLAAAADAVSGKSGWEVSPRVVLALFASHKESMYQDLLDNEADVLASDLVRAVALGPGANLAADRFSFEELDLDRIDELSPPEDSPLVLDADASQRQAVAAAVAGRSFVLDGPPGTGKSQTITNMIAGLMHAGRSVLFVSEKAAALDVVLDRLRSVGLDSYALALHSHNTSRKAVAQELGRALLEEPRAPQLSQEAVSQVRETRQALSGYADAMNEVREPLGQTLHDAIGRFGRLADAPVVYQTHAFRADRLSARDLRLIVEATQTIAEAWEAVADPVFPWRELRPEGPYPRPALEQAIAAREGLVTALARYDDLAPGAGPVHDRAGVERLVTLIGLLDSRSPVPETWLTTDDFAVTVNDKVDAFKTDLRRVRRSRDEARAEAGERWSELSRTLTWEPDDAERALAMLTPPGADPAGLTETRARELAREFENASDRLRRTHQDVADLGTRTGVDVPKTLAAVHALCDVVALAGTDHRPLEGWLAPDGAAEAESAAVAVVADALDAFFTRREQVLAARALASAEAGPGWADLGSGPSARQPENEQALAGLVPPGLDLTGLTRRRAARLADRFESLARTVESAGRHADSAAALLGCARPATTAAADDIAALVGTATAPDRTPAGWLDPAERARSRSAVGEIADAALKLDAAQAAARDTFTPRTATFTELPEAARRLMDGARGIGGLLSGTVRADRKLVAGLTHKGSWHSDLYDKLPLAVAWYTARARLRALAVDHADVLGPYATGPDGELPDVTGAREALAHAETVHRLAPDTVADPSCRSLLAAQLAHGSTAAPQLLAQGTELRRELSVWQQESDRAELAPYATDLTKRRLADVAGWLRAHLAPLRQADRLVETVTSTGRGDSDPDFEHTVATARAALLAAHAAQRETAAFAAQEDTDRALLGPWYRALDTDPADLDTDIAEYHGVGRLLRSARDMLRHRQGPATTERELLGPYATPGRIDTAALRAALDAAGTVARLVPETLADPGRRARLSETLAAGRQVPYDLLRQAGTVRTELDRWSENARRPHLATVAPVLAERSLDEIALWLRVHVEPFEEAAELVHAVARVTERPGDGLTLTAARAAVRAVADARAAEEEFELRDAGHRTLLGELYRGADTKWDTVRDAVDWAQRVRRTAHGGSAGPLTEAAARTMLSAPADPSTTVRRDEWQRQSDVLADCFEPQRADRVRRELGTSLSSAGDLLSRLDRDPYGPEAWTSCAQGLATLRAYRLDGLPEQLAQRGVSAAGFPSAVERAVLTAWIDHQLATDARLTPMRAVERDQLVDRFRTVDRDLVAAAHAEVIAACNSRRPRGTSMGPTAVIRSEAEKQRRHMPVRVLLDRTRHVVHRIKPCFMMSPLTVSQFLPSDFRFDVVIFDEASQVLPQDAVNSVYRGRSLIVAGDKKQLPPTSFFSATSGSDEDDEWDDDAADGFESILDACKASGVLRSLSLRWHYRSRHENLIAFSNHDFYSDAPMVTFPGALEESPDAGVEFFKAHGVYDRGGRKDNPGEAAFVAQRVMHHFATRPGRTLGVVALSKPQAEAIEEAVQKARAARPDLERFFTEDRLGGFFVKNLETVQGDERDVIILSVGYGPDAQGRLRQEFGPINREGGWRRLNVAVTRARRRMEVVASFHGGDLPESPNYSVRELKRYLEYAQHGPQILSTDAADPDAQPESPFEEEVVDVLRDWGYSVQPQVGVAGFRIDMAVRHPAAVGTYALGIECDGAMYHSSRAARDRDRLRESVLRDLGWNLHRIWGTDWYRNRREAMARLRTAVEAACARDPHGVREALAADSAAVASAPGGHERDTEPPSGSAVSYAPVMAEGPVSWSRPYRDVARDSLVELRVQACRSRGLPSDIELQDPEAGQAVADVALSVVDVEGPVEHEVILTRVRTAWEISRSGQVVQDRIGRALSRLARQGRITRDGSTYDLPGRDVAFARTPTASCERKVGQVPAVERRLVVHRMVEESPGVPREELLREVARFFGWSRLGSEIRDALTGDIDALVAAGGLAEHGGGLVLADDGTEG
ncbi:DUF3320 domain-containing protein [Streptomyces acidiscabies]|uniref:DUF3320 domain-containing protein n=1 Tax=Streptomyces acidiscabies TaxID=42234 RepID=UPI0009520E1A|nr:DUF3320 domain-containing protein [Streptomyces acidiscabies]